MGSNYLDMFRGLNWFLDLQSNRVISRLKKILKSLRSKFKLWERYWRSWCLTTLTWRKQYPNWKSELTIWTYTIVRTALRSMVFLNIDLIESIVETMSIVKEVALGYTTLNCMTDICHRLLSRILKKTIHHCEHGLLLGGEFIMQIKWAKKGFSTKHQILSSDSSIFCKCEVDYSETPSSVLW